MAPPGGWDANTTYILTVTSKTTGGSYTLGGTSFNPGTSYATQTKEFTGSLGEMRNNWSSSNQITFQRWDVSIKNKKMLNVHRLGGVGINDDRVYDEDFGHLYIDTTDFPTLRRGGKDYTSSSVLTVGGSIILSAINGTNSQTTSNIYFNAPNNKFQTGLIWRREVPGAVTYISGAILFDSELQNYSTTTTTGYSAGGLSFYTSDAGSGWSSSSAKRRMVIHGDGNVGIGTASPKFPLDVDDSNTSTDMTYWNRSTASSTVSNDGAYFSTAHDSGRDGSNYGQSEIGDLDSGTTYPRSSIGNFNIAAHFKNGVYISDGALYVSSDRRIKTNIVDVKDNLALEMVRNIPCRYYNYNDKLSRGTNATIGFIAQEVKEIYPRAVVERTQFIPNEMRNLNDLRWNDTTLFTDLSDCSGITYRFYVGNDPSGNDEIRKDIIGNSDNSFTFDTSYNNVFCYGKEVDDFHTLDKNKLFALNFSATQELDRKVTALETVGNQDHNVKILDLYKENQELKARLAKIEAFLGI